MSKGFSLGIHYELYLAETECTCQVLQREWPRGPSPKRRSFSSSQIRFEKHETSVFLFAKVVNSLAFDFKFASWYDNNILVLYLGLCNQDRKEKKLFSEMAVLSTTIVFEWARGSLVMYHMFVIYLLLAMYTIFMMYLMSFVSFMFPLFLMFHISSPREEKSDLEMDYKARLREMDEKHQHELQELEAIYQQKIMGEVERYQVLQFSR